MMMSTLTKADLSSRIERFNQNTHALRMKMVSVMRKALLCFKLLNVVLGLIGSTFYFFSN
jgi:hypothetical protein